MSRMSLQFDHLRQIRFNFGWQSRSNHFCKINNFSAVSIHCCESFWRKSLVTIDACYYRVPVVVFFQRSWTEDRVKIKMLLIIQASSHRMNQHIMKGNLRNSSCSEVSFKKESEVYSSVYCCRWGRMSWTVHDTYILISLFNSSSWPVLVLK